MNKKATPRAMGFMTVPAINNSISFIFQLSCDGMQLGVDNMHSPEKKYPVQIARKSVLLAISAKLLNERAARIFCMLSVGRSLKPFLSVGDNRT